MDNARYQQIASINIHHSYFADGLCQGISFHPDENTSVLLQRLGFFFRSSKNGFGLYADAARLSKDIQAIEKNKPVWSHLHFEAAFQDPHFFRFTDLPNSSGENVLYVSQSPTSLPNNRIARLSVSFSAENDQAGKGALVIELTELLQYRSENGNAIFDFHFTAKSTQWNYVILNKEMLASSRLRIADHSFTFPGPHLVGLPNGNNAFLFSSGSHRIAFADAPKNFFSLFDDGGLQTKTTIGHLPVAHPGNQSKLPGVNGADPDASFIYIN
jgi:hypothetical protein